ncbi:hypothetical protein DFH09DRAFT_1095442 [Mycena vulgaris]|nr:hypothetical protein DFH09DRAFT_1095442 [Mycena vulgaris]
MGGCSPTNVVARVSLNGKDEGESTGGATANTNDGGLEKDPRTRNADGGNSPTTGATRHPLNEVVAIPTEDVARTCEDEQNAATGDVPKAKKGQLDSRHLGDVRRFLSLVFTHNMCPLLHRIRGKINGIIPAHSSWISLRTGHSTGSEFIQICVHMWCTQMAASVVRKLTNAGEEFDSLKVHGWGASIAMAYYLESQRYEPRTVMSNVALYLGTRFMSTYADGNSGRDGCGAVSQEIMERTRLLGISKRRIQSNLDELS